MSTPVHICFVALHVYPVLAADGASSFVGGAEVQQTVQMRALQRAGFRVSVLVEDSGQPDVVDCNGIQVYKVPSAGNRGLPLTRFFYPRTTDIVGLLRRVSPDIVFIQTASIQVLAGALYAKLFGKKFVFAGASDPDFKLGRLPDLPPQHTWFYRLGLRGADAIIVQNLAQMRMLKENFGREGHLIQNGYEEPLAAVASPKGYVLWAATVKQLKRPDLFIELARRLPDRRFVMVGGSSVETPEAKAYADRMSATAKEVPNIEVVGHVPFAEVGRYFDRAGVFVNTSDYEGLPNTFMQSWIRGIPTVSFVRPESAPGVTGTLACADLEEMVGTVERLTGDESQWRLASDACRRCFQSHHTMEGTVERYRAVFSSVLQSRMGAQPCHR